MVDNITEAFIQKDPRNADHYRKNASEYKMKLSALDMRYRKELSRCKKEPFYTQDTGLLLIQQKDTTSNMLRLIISWLNPNPLRRPYFFLWIKSRMRAYIIFIMKK